MSPIAIILAVILPAFTVAGVAAFCLIRRKQIRASLGGNKPKTPCDTEETTASDGREDMHLSQSPHDGSDFYYHQACDHEETMAFGRGEDVYPNRQPPQYASDYRPRNSKSMSVAELYSYEGKPEDVGNLQSSSYYGHNRVLVASPKSECSTLPPHKNIDYSQSNFTLMVNPQVHTDDL